jgi:hypothetical protein
MIHIIPNEYDSSSDESEEFGVNLLRKMTVVGHEDRPINFLNCTYNIIGDISMDHQKYSLEDGHCLYSS